MTSYLARSSPTRRNCPWNWQLQGKNRSAGCGNQLTVCGDVSTVCTFHGSYINLSIQLRIVSPLRRTLARPRGTAACLMRATATHPRTRPPPTRTVVSLIRKDSSPTRAAAPPSTSPAPQASTLAPLDRTPAMRTKTLTPRKRNPAMQARPFASLPGTPAAPPRPLAPQSTDLRHAAVLFPVPHTPISDSQWRCPKEKPQRMARKTPAPPPSALRPSGRAAAHTPRRSQPEEPERSEG